ncbi:hypothetical protein [Paractinoplanes rishiriensis]|uniref:hypothetical protein n=1 Tax=Paractinoplanes rishiriensis TaxID=1050105 RepID=UPI00194095D0|nr:hypothetical protein [Actinoplanes rishiriensis]
MTRRWIFPVAALAVSGSVALLLINPTTRRMPEVTAARSQCQQFPASTSPAETALIPDRRYHSLQLCPAASTTAWTPTKFIDKRESINLVRRLSSLPTTPGEGPCPDPPTDRWDLILSSGLERLTIRLDLGRCDTVSRAGVLRYGATALHRDLTTLIDDGGT